MYEMVKTAVSVANKVDVSLFADEQNVDLINLESHFMDYMKSLSALVETLNCCTGELATRVLNNETT